MKKLLAMTMVCTMLLALASCGEEGTSSVASTASTAAPVSSAASAPVSSAVSAPAVSPVVSQPVAQDSSNLALTATPIDDGSDEYYSETAGLDALADGNYATGWQYKKANDQADEENPVTEETEGAYKAGDDNWYLPMEFKDGIYAGLTWDEAVTIDELKVYFEFDSRPVASTKGYVVEVTTDGKEWKEVKDAEYTYIEEKVQPDEADVITFKAMEVKGVRVKIYKCSTKYSPKIWEFEAFAPEADAE